VSLAVYIKAPPIYRKLPKIAKDHSKRDRFFYGLISAVGAFSIGFAIWPYFAWQLTTASKLTQKIEKFPIPQAQVLSASTILANEVQVAKDPDGFSYFTTTYKPEGTRPTEFFITVPKLEIKDARVLIDSLRFDKSLAHFPGSALPGEVGNSFITGHSVLPQFADPKNYWAIFTKLSDLEIGDNVYVEISGQKLSFVVQYAKIVDSRDLSVLLPISATGRNLTLMTCVPPGTNLKRLVVITGLL